MKLNLASVLGLGFVYGILAAMILGVNHLFLPGTDYHPIGKIGFDVFFYTGLISAVAWGLSENLSYPIALFGILVGGVTLFMTLSVFPVEPVLHAAIWTIIGFTALFVLFAAIRAHVEKYTVVVSSPILD